MNWSDFLRALPEVAQSPYAFIAYVVLIGAWVYASTTTSKVNNTLRAIEHLPEEDRIELIKRVFGTEPKNLSSTQWLQARKQTFIFVGFCVTVIAILVIILVTFAKGIGDEKKKAVELDNPFGESEVLVDGRRLFIGDNLDSDGEQGWIKIPQYLFQIKEPAPGVSLRHELLSAPAYAEKLGGHEAAEQIADIHLLRDAQVFRIYSEPSINLTLGPDSRIGEYATKDEIQDAETYVFGKKPTGVDLDEVRKVINHHEHVSFANELAILIIDRKLYEKTMIFAQGGRKVKASALTFMLSDGGVLPVFDILGVESASVSKDGRLWAFYGKRVFHNVEVDGRAQEQIYMDFYRIYAINNTYIYQITLSFIPNASQPRETWDLLLNSLQSLRIAENKGV